MNIIVEVRSADRLARVVDLIHDQRFDIRQLTYDSMTATLRLPFEKERRDVLRGHWHQLLFGRWSVPIIEYVLELRHVRAYKIHDTAQIVNYNFLTIEDDRGKGRTEIAASPGLRIVVETSDLYVAVVSTGRNVGVRRLLTIFGCEISWAPKERAGVVCPRRVCWRIYDCIRHSVNRKPWGNEGQSPISVTRERDPVTWAALEPLAWTGGARPCCRVSAAPDGRSA